MNSLRASVTFFLGLLQCSHLPGQDTDQIRVAGSLEPRRAVERDLGGGQSDLFTMQVAGGQFVRLTVKQIGVHVFVTVLDASGKTVLQANRLNGAFGEQAGSFVAETTGEDRVLLTSAPGTTGRYRIELLDSREPTEADRSRIDAERVQFLAGRAQQPGTREGRLRAIELYERSRLTWRRLGDVYEEGVNLISIGTLRDAIGEKQKALDTYTQALRLFHGSGQRSVEATVLINMGSIYDSLGDPRKALDYNMQALPVSRTFGSPPDEATVLNNIATIYSGLGEKQKALDYFGQALAMYRTIRYRSREAVVLNNIGNIYSNLGDKQKARDYFEQALTIHRATGDRSGQAVVLNNIGTVYKALGEKRKALEFFGQALPIFQAAGDTSSQATLLNNIGLIHSDLGENQKALEYYEQALQLYRATGAPASQATTLNNIGNLCQSRGDHRKALEYFSEALQLNQSAGNRAGEAVDLNNIGLVYEGLGEKQKAIDYYLQALRLRRATGDRAGEATSLNNLGMVYDGLGQKQQALEHYLQALPLYRSAGDRSGEGTALTNMGMVYSALGEKQKALDYLGQSLTLFRDTGDRYQEAITLNDIGQVHYTLGDKKKALDYYRQALPILQSIGHRGGEAVILNGMGSAYFYLGDTQKALDCYAQALPIRRAIGDRAGEALTLAWLRVLFEHSDPELAIAFGKQAVNVLQTIRRDNQGLVESLRRSYEQSIESYYRSLASLLVSRQRFGEAEEALNLLKDKEAADFARRDAVADQLRPATLLDYEKKALDRYEQILGQVVTFGQQKSTLLARATKETLTTAEREQANQLDRDLAAANTVLLRFLQEQQMSAPASSAVARRTDEFRDAASVQGALRKLGPDTVAIYTLVMPDKYVAMLVTSGARKAYTTAIKESDLNARIFEFRQRLQNPQSDPLPLAQELYRIVFPAGLRQDLDSMQARTILWSVDSTLRYIPIAALHDGTDYLVRRFRNSLITPASLTRLAETSNAEWQGIGFGVSEAKAAFSALPAVPEELHRIFRQKQNDAAPVPGTVRLNADFTRDAFQNDLRQPNKSVVHIATHFDSRPGVAANSHLLLGDGSELSLAEIESSEQLFDGVDLLTLSACSTAFTNHSEDGREVDSFGTIAQRLGARGVIASLWSVNDEATARLMETMYRTRQSQPALGKSESLRQAQEQMASGALQPAGPEAGDRGGQSRHGARGANGWKHPYYWAPFILIGNGK